MEFEIIHIALVRGSERLIIIPDHVFISEINPLIKKYGVQERIPEDYILSNECSEKLPGQYDTIELISPVRMCDLKIQDPPEFVVKMPHSSAEY